MDLTARRCLSVSYVANGPPNSKKPPFPGWREQESVLWQAEEKEQESGPESASQSDWPLFLHRAEKI